MSIDRTFPRRLSSGTPQPDIQPLRWIDARQVLPDEARDFTPWLAENIHLLSTTLGLEELSLIETEVDVQGYELDILASGINSEGSQLSVVIENQYGRTDHRHLGQLITYAASAAQEQENILAVWIVEHVHPAHLAAVEFLNRTSTSGVGYFMVQVRFAPGPNGFHVYFEIQARPNEFLREAQRTQGRQLEDVSPARRQFMSQVFEGVREPLVAEGFRSVSAHPQGWWIRLRLPNRMAFAPLLTIFVRATTSTFYVFVHTRPRGFSAEENYALIEVLRERFADSFLRHFGGEVRLSWHPAEGTKGDQVRADWSGGGYENGNAGEAAEWARRVASAWLSAFSEQPNLDVREALISQQSSQEMESD